MNVPDIALVLVTTSSMNLSWTTAAHVAFERDNDSSKNCRRKNEAALTIFLLPCVGLIVLDWIFLEGRFLIGSVQCSVQQSIDGMGVIEIEWKVGYGSVPVCLMAKQVIILYYYYQYDDAFRNFRSVFRKFREKLSLTLCNPVTGAKCTQRRKKKF